MSAVAPSFAAFQRAGLLMLAQIADAQALPASLAGTDVIAAISGAVAA